MGSARTTRRLPGIALASILAVGFVSPGARGDDPSAPPEGRYAKLLQKAPEARLGAIIDVVGQRGDAADLAYLFRRATAPAGAGGFADATRRRALDALAEGAARDARPSGDLGGIVALLRSGPGFDPPTRAGAIRLAGLWRVGTAVPDLAAMAAAPAADASLRDSALDALARINDEAARSALTRLAGPDTSPHIRRQAVGALARVDAPLAAATVAELATKPGAGDLGPLLGPILDQQGGAERLASALAKRDPTPEAARALLDAVRGLGRSDEALVGPLAKRAGVGANAATLGLSSADLARYNVEVPRDGDPARGEAIFRRATLNCQKCHAINGAAGGVGPELTGLGLSSPVDYVVRSILEPDESIKEEFQTRIVSLDDGRVLQGIVVAEDDNRVVLKDANGDRREVPAASIEESRRGGSLMPKGLVDGLSRGEFLDLCRFLSELGRPGAYAIRPVPTVQRWRAIAIGSEEARGDSAPTTATARSGVEWAPLYAWTDGSLPAREVEAAVGGPLALIEGELLVTGPGRVALRVEPSRGDGLALFLDGRAVARDERGAATVAVEAGTRRLTLRVDCRDAATRDASIRVEVARAAESPAEFTVVGGK